MHDSVTSHGPALARQTVPPATNTSVGHETLVPSQFSAMSHTPIAPRQTVPLPARTSLGQVAFVPVQSSARSQTPAEARHVEVFGKKALLGHAAAEPVQVSATSQAPAEARQIVAAVKKVQVPMLPETLHASQAPPHAVLQHTPSTQLPDVHWALLVQITPLASLGKQLDPEQYSDMLQPTTSAGQLMPVFVQFSAGSHPPLDERQTELVGR